MEVGIDKEKFKIQENIEQKEIVGRIAAADFNDRIMTLELSAPLGYYRMLAPIVNGGLAGLFGVSCTFPLDLTKTRLQNQPSMDGKRMYKSFLDCFMKVLRDEGFRGLYRGFRPNFIGIVPEKCIKLIVNDFMRRLLSSDGRNITMKNELLAAATAGFCQVVVTAPMEMLKIYGQDAGRINALSGKSISPPKSAIRYVYRKHGVFGFYKGACATLLRDIPFSMIYFPLFSFCNKLGMKDDDTSSPFIYTLLSGMISGCVSAIIVNPFDVVKTRLQSIHHTTHNYSGVINCFQRIYKEEGLKSFLRGAIPRAAAIGPLFGIAQTVYYLGVGETVFGIPRQRPV